MESWKDKAEVDIYVFMAIHPTDIDIESEPQTVKH